MIQEYLNNIGQLVLQYGYWIVLIGIMLENLIIIGFFFPGIFILISAGFYSGLDTLNIYYTLIAAFIGTLLGDNLSYYLGKFGLIKFNKIKKFFQRTEELKKKLTSRKGKTFIIFYHFPIYARMVVPTILGMMNYNFRVWLIYNSIGAAIFSTTFVLIGYIIGRTSRVFNEAVDISQYIQWFFFILLFVFIILGIREFRKLINAGRNDNKK